MISLTLSGMSTFYKGKVGLSRLFAVTTILTLFLFVLTFGSWWSVGRSAGAEGVATSLLANNEVREGVAEKLIEQVTSDVDAEIKDVVEEKKELLVQAVADVLASPEVNAETKKVIDQIYSFYTGEASSGTIDVNSLIQPILDSMAKIDPTFDSPEIASEQIEPIKLDNTGSAPNFAPIKSGLALSTIILLTLLALSIFGLAKFSTSKNSLTGIIGWEFATIGTLLIALYYGANAGIKSATTSASDPLVNTAAPIVAQSFLNIFRTQGILLLLLGSIGIAIWSRARRVQPTR